MYSKSGYKCRAMVLTDFQPGRTEIAGPVSIMADYHINALQFYDWMYRHEQFLTTEEPYVDLLGRQLSRQVVDELMILLIQGVLLQCPTQQSMVHLSISIDNILIGLFIKQKASQLCLVTILWRSWIHAQMTWMRYLLNQFEEIPLKPNSMEFTWTNMGIQRSAMILMETLLI